MKQYNIVELCDNPFPENNIFLYPTDSLYGLGAIAIQENVLRIDAIKKRSPGKSYSVIVPNFNRICDNFVINPLTINQQWKQWQEVYGPITVLCKRKNPDFMPWISNNEYIGLRYIQHPFQEFVTFLGKPFLSTSANISGESYDEKKLLSVFQNCIDIYVKNTSPMTGKGSTLIYYDSGDIIIRN